MMRRLFALILLIGIIALLVFGILMSNWSVSAGQGKGGKVVAKPTSTPAPKKTTHKRGSPSAGPTEALRDRTGAYTL